MKTVLPNIIHSDQAGFLPGNYIGENVRLALDMINPSMFQKWGKFKSKFSSLPPLPNSSLVKNKYQQ